MVCIDCPLALHIKDLVHPFKSIFVIHIHLLLLSLLSISLANCPCILFSFHSYFLCYFSVFLNSLRSTVSTFVIVLLVLTSTSNGSILFSTYQPRPFSSLFTLFSHPISPLQSFFQETHPCSIIFWVQFFIHCHKFPGISVHFLQFMLVLLRNLGTIPHNGDCSSVQRYYLIKIIKIINITIFYLSNCWCLLLVSMLGQLFEPKTQNPTFFTPYYFRIFIVQWIVLFLEC